MGNNRIFHKMWLCALLLMAIPGFADAQEFINIRKISLKRGDTTVVAGILADVKIDEVIPTVFYYWYANGKIYSNQGGYSGNLLHGPYVEHFADGNLLLKGNYERGVKSGRWTYWYRDGAIKESTGFEGGLLEGNITRYTPDGRILYSANYRKDVLHGKMNTVVNDTLFEISFKKGIEKKRTPLHVFTE